MVKQNDFLELQNNVWSGRLDVSLAQTLARKATLPLADFLPGLMLSCKVNPVSLAGEAYVYFRVTVCNSCFYSRKHLLMPRGQRTSIQTK